MLTLKTLEQENAVGFVLDGEVTEAGINQIVDALRTKIAQYGKVRLYGEVQNIGGWKSFKAFFSNMKAKLETIGKLEKYAVVSDSDWMESIGGVADFLTPGMDIKFFKSAEREKALIWLKEAASEDIHGAAVVEVGVPGVLGFSIHGKLTNADYEQFNRLMAEQLQTQDRLNLYLEMVDLEGITLKGLWGDLKAGVKYYTKIDKVAVLGGKGWLESATKVSNFLTPGLEMKYFTLAEKEKAVAWLAEPYA